MKFQKTEKYLMLLALLTLSFAACKKYNSIGYTPGTGAPVISSVSTLSRTVVDTAILITTTYDTAGNVTTKIDSNKTNQSYIPLDSTTTTGEKQRYDTACRCEAHMKRTREGRDRRQRDPETRG